MALAGLALFYLFRYVELSIALANNGLQPVLAQSIRALWLAFACQALLIGLLYAIVAWKPHAVSREVIIIFGLLQLVEGVLLFSFAGSGVAAGLLIVAAACVLLGSVLWPKRLPPPSVTSPTDAVR